MPLFENQGLGIALFSYDGSLYWGFNADWDLVPDLHDVVGAVEHEFRLLADAAGAATPSGGEGDGEGEAGATAAGDATSQGAF